MSDIAITIQHVDYVEPHPNADRLDIVKILGTQCVAPRGEYLCGDRVVYFPPDMMIPEVIAEELGVKRYLKHVNWGGSKKQSRIAACRLRGEPSYGFIVPHPDCKDNGTDLTANYRGEQYEPPEILPKLSGIKGGKRFQLDQGDFEMYTNIQHYWRYPDVFDDLEDVVVTEKIHGTNSRVGVLFEDGEWVYVAGSHRVRWAEDKAARRYWAPLKSEGMLGMLAELCGETANVIVYGEIFGSGVQDMDYGFHGDEGYRVFDIKVNGRFMDWHDVATFCIQHGVPTVPVLYRGPWSSLSKVVEKMASGGTSVGTPERKFKGREGIVIKPTKERLTDRIGGRGNPSRAIVKFVSADYLDRKGSQDNG